MKENSVDRTPHWQHAKIIKSHLFPHMIGQLVWVVNADPLLSDYIEIQSDQPRATTLLLSSQLLDDRGNALVFPLEYLELQAEFCDEPVPRIPYVKWSDPMFTLEA